MIRLFALFLGAATIVAFPCYSVDRGDFVYVSGYDQEHMPNYVYRPHKPLMWTAQLKVDRAVIAGYEHKFFSYKNYLEMYTGVSGGYMGIWRGGEDRIFVLSAYLMTRLYLLHKDAFKLFILYSPAGPSLLSKNHFSNTAFSNKFVFQNQLGLGLSFEKSADIEFFLKLYHYSNGDLFSLNGGIDIPIMLGCSFRL